MKAVKRLIAAFLCLWLLAGCAGDPAPSTPTEPTAPPPTAEELYDSAMGAMLSAPNRILTYTVSLTRTVSGQTYTSSTSGTASFSGIQGSDMLAQIRETLENGPLSTEHVLTYCGGAGYSQISGCIFSKNMTPAEFIASQYPAVPIDPRLYKRMEMTAGEGGTAFTFSEPTGPESWIPNAELAQMTRGAGTVILNSAGAPVNASYDAEYTCGNTVYRLNYSVRIATPSTLDLTAVHPEHLENAVALDCLEAPRLLTQVVGDIFTAQTIRCDLSESIYSQVIPLTRKRRTAATLYGSGKDMNATLQNTVEVTDFKGQPTTLTQDYQFAGGICISSENGGEPTVQEGITFETMRTTVEDTVLSGLMATGYLAGAALTDGEAVFTLQFAGNDAYGNGLSGDIGAFLNMDLDGLADSHETKVAAGYLTVDRETLLPVAMGISFERFHVFGDAPYQLSYTLDQTLSLLPQE